MADEAMMIATPVLSNAVEKLDGAFTPRAHALVGLATLRRGETASGSAYTIRLRRAPQAAAANVEAVLKAYDDAPAGSFVVVQVLDDVGGAVLGDIIAHRLKMIGVAGVAICGPVRDLLGLEKFGPPLWYAKTTMTGLEMAWSAAEAQVDLSIGATTIRPGDRVFADIDGVFVVSAQAMPEITLVAQVVAEREVLWHGSLASGRSLVETLLT